METIAISERSLLLGPCGGFLFPEDICSNTGDSGNDWITGFLPTYGYISVSLWLARSKSLPNVTSKTPVYTHFFRLDSWERFSSILHQFLSHTSGFWCFSSTNGRQTNRKCASCQYALLYQPQSVLFDQRPKSPGCHEVPVVPEMLPSRSQLRSNYDHF